MRSLTLPVAFTFSALMLVACTETHSEKVAATTPPDEVTVGNLLDREAFWPYRVEMAADWSPPGSALTLRKGAKGILIRVEPEGHARIDLPSYGIFRVPITSTNIVEAANGIRRGEIRKRRANFTTSVVPRLFESSGVLPNPLNPIEAEAAAGFLNIFADPESEAFEAMARAIRERAIPEAVMPVFFPQGDAPDIEVMRVLQKQGWLIPFMMERLSEPYSTTLVTAEEYPRVLLTSSEGRSYFEEVWGEGTADRLVEAMKNLKVQAVAAN